MKPLANYANIAQGKHRRTGYLPKTTLTCVRATYNSPLNCC
jgi:hypothetical protein